MEVIEERRKKKICGKNWDNRKQRRHKIDENLSFLDFKPAHSTTPSIWIAASVMHWHYAFLTLLDAVSCVDFTCVLLAKSPTLLKGELPCAAGQSCCGVTLYLLCGVMSACASGYDLFICNCILPREGESLPLVSRHPCPHVCGDDQTIQPATNSQPIN